MSRFYDYGPRCKGQRNGVPTSAHTKELSTRFGGEDVSSEKQNVFTKNCWHHNLEMKQRPPSGESDKTVLWGQSEVTFQKYKYL